MAVESISIKDARALALSAQGFGARVAGADANALGWAAQRRAIERMGLIQLDSISVAVRSHYMPLFSRLGGYDRDAFERRAFGCRPPRRALFEYWGHEASLLPLATQPLLRWRMARAERLQQVYGGIARFVREKPAFINAVLKQVDERGPLASRDLEPLAARRRGSAMWQWADTKTALEFLFWSGRLSTAYRRNFERVYDLTERVLPAELLARPTPSESDAQRELLALAASAHGVASAADLRDYYRLSAAGVDARLGELVEDGRLRRVEVEGWRSPAYRPRGARTLPAATQVCALLTPFDPLVWQRDRAERLFGFRYRIEIYLPAAQRRYGYYVLPFLQRGALSARVDLKTDRAARSLRVLAAYDEDRSQRAATAAALAAELDRLRGWLGLERVSVARRGPLATALAGELRGRI